MIRKNIFTYVLEKGEWVPINVPLSNTHTLTLRMAVDIQSEHMIYHQHHLTIT